MFTSDAYGKINRRGTWSRSTVYNAGLRSACCLLLPHPKMMPEYLESVQLTLGRLLFRCSTAQYWHASEMFSDARSRPSRQTGLWRILCLRFSDNIDVDSDWVNTFMTNISSKFKLLVAFYSRITSHYWTDWQVHRLFVPWTIRTMLRIKDNKPRTWGHTPIMMWMFRLFQTNCIFCLQLFLLRGGRISRCTAGERRHWVGLPDVSQNTT